MYDLGGTAIAIAHDASARCSGGMGVLYHSRLGLVEVPRPRCGSARRRRTVRCKSQTAKGAGTCAAVVCACPLLIHPQINSLVLAYACPVADAVRDTFEEENRHAPRCRARHWARRVGLSGCMSS